MPSQLVKNDAIYFICARDFLYAGEEYKMGEKFDQDLAVGQIDLLVRTRRLYAVVDKIEDKPRHWHQHIWLRKDISKKLGLIHREDSDILVGSSLYNRVKQINLTEAPVDIQETQVDGEPADVGAHQKNVATLNAATDTVLEQENEPESDEDEDEQTEPDLIVNPPEVEETDEDDEDEVAEDDEDEVTEDDLYDPSEHNGPDVVAYLESDISEEERQRVLAAERLGKNRKGVLND